MPKPSEIIDMVASLQNDTAQDDYTDAAVLPYLNMALRDLQEEFELNSIPVTEETSVAITIPSGTTKVPFGGNPGLPANLIEINQLWESVSGQETWTPMFKRDYIPQYMVGLEYARFRIWAWKDNAIELLPCSQDNDIKLNYIKSLFPTVTDTSVDLGPKFVNVFSYLGYHTAALCSMFIGENETRAAALQGQAEQALTRSMGISIKGKQSIQTRRKPFRFGYKMRRGIWR